MYKKETKYSVLIKDFVQVIGIFWTLKANGINVMHFSCLFKRKNIIIYYVNLICQALFTTGNINRKRVENFYLHFKKFQIFFICISSLCLHVKSIVIFTKSSIYFL